MRGHAHNGNIRVSDTGQAFIHRHSMPNLKKARP
jgi:hypothetical protein